MIDFTGCKLMLKATSSTVASLLVALAESSVAAHIGGLVYQDISTTSAPEHNVAKPFFADLSGSGEGEDEGAGVGQPLAEALAPAQGQRLARSPSGSLAYVGAPHASAHGHERVPSTSTKNAHTHTLPPCAAPPAARIPSSYSSTQCHTRARTHRRRRAPRRRCCLRVVRRRCGSAAAARAGAGLSTRQQRPPSEPVHAAACNERHVSARISRPICLPPWVYHMISQNGSGADEEKTELDGSGRLPEACPFWAVEQTRSNNSEKFRVFRILLITALCFNKELVLNTWSGLLLNEESLLDDWTYTKGVLAESPTLVITTFCGCIHHDEAADLEKCVVHGILMAQEYILSRHDWTRILDIQLNSPLRTREGKRFRKLLKMMVAYGAKVDLSNRDNRTLIHCILMTYLERMKDDINASSRPDTSLRRADRDPVTTTTTQNKHSHGFELRRPTRKSTMDLGPIVLFLHDLELFSTVKYVTVQ
ncbi:hypothetical protein GGX14DRAFT_605990 [Mycena pura]|uniref:Uncharacterized protein n=1 Tax=Mycena pura TaxID=153505 RepID=A0AAD6UU04_9AGAR|nr:hypothetical protein GGX14DRAFT_605990 [Mycena pura]